MTYDADETAEYERARALRGLPDLRLERTCIRCGAVITAPRTMVLYDRIEAHNRKCDPDYSSRYVVI